MSVKHPQSSTAPTGATDLRLVGGGLVYRRSGSAILVSKRASTDRQRCVPPPRNTVERNQAIRDRTRQNLANALEELHAGAPGTRWRSYAAVVVLDPSEVDGVQAVIEQLDPLLAGRLRHTPTRVLVSLSRAVQVSPIERASAMLSGADAPEACVLVSATRQGAAAVWLSRGRHNDSYARLSYVAHGTPGRPPAVSMADVLHGVRLCCDDLPRVLVHEGGLGHGSVRTLSGAVRRALPETFLRWDDRSTRNRVGDLGCAMPTAQLIHAAHIAEAEGRGVVGLVVQQPGGFVVEPPHRPRSPGTTGPWPWDDDQV